jgi:hypothetical protein
MYPTFANSLVHRRWLTVYRSDSFVERAPHLSAAAYCQTLETTANLRLWDLKAAKAYSESMERLRKEFLDGLCALGDEAAKRKYIALHKKRIDAMRSAITQLEWLYDRKLGGSEVSDHEDRDYGDGHISRAAESSRGAGTRGNIAQSLKGPSSPLAEGGKEPGPSPGHALVEWIFRPVSLRNRSFPIGSATNGSHYAGRTNNREDTISTIQPDFCLGYCLLRKLFRYLGLAQWWWTSDLSMLKGRCTGTDVLHGLGSCTHRGLGPPARRRFSLCCGTTKIVQSGGTAVYARRVLGLSNFQRKSSMVSPRFFSGGGTWCGRRV